MTKLPKVQLIYFKLRALAEAPQMMMHYANVPYTYEMAWDFYGKPWPEAKLRSRSDNCRYWLSMVVPISGKAAPSLAMLQP